MSKIEKKIVTGNYNWKEGLVSGSVYYYDQDLINLVREVYGKASYTNPLHPDVFPGLCKMEAEVIRIAANLFHGDSKTCGTVCYLLIVIIKKNICNKVK